MTTRPLPLPAALGAATTHPLLVALVLALASACGAPPGPREDASADDAPRADTTSAPGDGTADDASAPPRDGAAPLDAPSPPPDGGLAVRCGFGSPHLLVTQSAGSATTMLRLPLVFPGGARGIRVTAVSQRASAGTFADGGTAPELRAWDPATLRGPDGFDGTATARDGVPEPEVLFLASAPSRMEETAACALPPWARDGSLHVEGTTADRGAFTLDCPLSTPAGEYNPTRLVFACARGVPGWVDGLYASSFVHPPSPGVSFATFVHLHNVTSAAMTGLAVSSATVRAHSNTYGTPDPPPWELGAAGHVLFLTSSLMPWSGPVAPLAQQDASWAFRDATASVPAGFCIRPPMGMPSPPTLLQFTLRGTSSAGAWEWESDTFVCVTP